MYLILLYHDYFPNTPGSVYFSPTSIPGVLNLLATLALVLDWQSVYKVWNRIPVGPPVNVHASIRDLVVPVPNAADAQ